MDIRHAGCAFVAAAALLGTTPAPQTAPSANADVSSTPLTPEAIYLRAVHAMKSAPEPPYVTFRETVSGRNFRLECTSDGMSLNLHHGDSTGTYDVWFRTSDGSAISKDVARATASPCPGALLVPAGSVIPTLGATQPSPSPTPDAASGSSAGPPIIAAVHVDASRYYRIELAGHENLDGNDVYHLKLTAYRDPALHPLTDLYVDPQTFLVREARGEVSLHMVVASGRFAGVVDFDRFGDYWLLKHEAFDAAANALLVHAHMTAVVDATNVTTPDDLPGIPFPTAQPRATPTAAR
jgi:hypothetical protein